ALSILTLCGGSPRRISFSSHVRGDAPWGIVVTARLLIEAIVRQMTVLLAELATSGGLRAPLANVADRVFIELARELDEHGVSRSVSADMFGMALRTYLRRI